MFGTLWFGAKEALVYELNQNFLITFIYGSRKEKPGKYSILSTFLHRFSNFPLFQRKFVSFFTDEKEETLNIFADEPLPK